MPVFTLCGRIMTSNYASLLARVRTSWVRCCWWWISHVRPSQCCRRQVSPNACFRCYGTAGAAVLHHTKEPPSGKSANHKQLVRGGVPGCGTKWHKVVESANTRAVGEIGNYLQSWQLSSNKTSYHSTEVDYTTDVGPRPIMHIFFSSYFLLTHLSKHL